MRSAGAIVRVSTAKQLEGTSPEKQLEAVRFLADAQGYELEDRHAWQMAESGALRDRVGFRLALEAVEAREISRLYVYSIDRLGRSLLDMLLFLRDLGDLGVECWEADKQRPLNPDDFMVQIEGAVASKDRHETVRKLQEGRRRAIRAGKFSGGVTPFGYRLNPTTKKLEIEPGEADVVRMIFECVIEERMSVTGIARRLTALEIPTHAKRRERKTSGIWRNVQVHNILRTETYTGHWVYGKRSKKMRPEDRIEVEVPAIISLEKHHRAAEILKGNRWPLPHNTKRNYLLRGLIKCGNCGKSYVGGTVTSRGEERRYYRCSGRMKWRDLPGPKCMNKSVRGEVLEGVIWDDVKRFVTKPEVAIEQLRAQQAPLDATLGEHLAEVETQIKELERRERNHLRIAAESQHASIQALDDVLKEIMDSQRSLVSYREQLRNRLGHSDALAQELFGVAERLTKLQVRIDEASFDEKRRAVEVLVKNICVDPQIIKGKPVAIITVTYRFDDPDSSSPALLEVPARLVAEDSTLLRQ